MSLFPILNRLALKAPTRTRLSSSPAPSRLFGASALILAVGLATSVRIFHLGFGLPYIDYWDEAQVVSASLSMLLEPKYTTTFFNYGNLPIYLAVLAGLPTVVWYRILGEEITLENALPFSDYPWLVDYESTLLFARGAWFIAGVLTIAGVFTLVKSMVGLWPAVFSALLLAVNPLHILFSTRIPPDGLASSLAFASVGIATVFLWRQKPWLLFGSVTFGALAAATKYNYGTVVFASVVAYLVSSEGQTLRERALMLLRLSGVAVIAFAIAMPSALAHPRLFISSVLYEVNHYQEGHAGHESEPWLGQAIFQATELNSLWGFGPLVLAVVGLVALLSSKGLPRKIGLVFSVPYVPFLLVMLSGTVNFHRNYLLLYPVIALLAGLGLFFAFNGGSWSTLSRRLLVLRSLLLGAVGLLSLTPNLVSAVEGARSSYVAENSRTQLVETLGAQGICQGARKVLLDSRVFLSPRQWQAHCPGSLFERIPVEELAGLDHSQATLVVTIGGSEFPGKPILVLNEGAGYAGFGPDFNPPLDVYLFEKKETSSVPEK